MQTQSHVSERPELTFALVGPAGVRLRDLSRRLKEHLGEFRYESRDIHLSNLLEKFVGWTPERDSREYTRIVHRQTIANNFRQQLSIKLKSQKHGASALARAAIVAIRAERRSITGDPDKPASACAYILDQLKRPEEVELLREIYGSSLIVLAAHAPHSSRVDTLSKLMAEKDQCPVNGQHRSDAELVIDKDANQQGSDELGQNTRDTYPLSDFFADLGNQSGENSVNRFVDLLFGHPFHTPMVDEFAMYQARSVALHSSDESRQVGAVVVELTIAADKPRNVRVVASGMNEVPRRGGGYYGFGNDDSPDGRDQWLKAYRQTDHARRIKIEALVELIGKIRDQGWLTTEQTANPANQLANELFPHLKGTQFMDIGEFGRTVHAEMAALIDSAQRGVAVRGLTMHVTTFPCHNCAKHIIAAGLKRVVYLEPYPKSRADALHGDEIILDPIAGSQSDDRVIFSQFTGIAPRQYQRLFSMSRRGGRKFLNLNDWNNDRSRLAPQYVVKNASKAYLLAERQELDLLPQDLYTWDQSVICPG